MLSAISFLMENGKGSHFTSGYDKNEKQLDAKEELNRETHETPWTSGYLGGCRRVSSPPSPPTSDRKTRQAQGPS